MKLAGKTALVTGGTDGIGREIAHQLGQKGATVNVTSGLAIAPRASGPIYCATKAGLRSFTMALRAQLAKTRIHVLEVLPPVVETRMTEGNRHRKMPASECARQIVAAMERGRD